MIIKVRIKPVPGFAKILKATLFLLISQIAWAAGAVGEFIYVPDNTAGIQTIQDGIDAAAHTNDTVCVIAGRGDGPNGEYIGEGNRDISFYGRAIRVISVKNFGDQPSEDNAGVREMCIIDCQGAGRGFVFDSGEGNNS